MEEVVIALGSNLGDRLGMLQKAGVFLEQLSESPIRKASVWQSDPVGAAKYPFYNSAIKLSTSLVPGELLRILKQFELDSGREKNPQKWGPRILDLDIIRYGNLVIEQDNLIIPHPEYKNRLFVLLPMAEIDPAWKDPGTNNTLPDLIKKAPDLHLFKTDLIW